MEDIQYPVSPGLEDRGCGGKNKGACGELYGRSGEGWSGNDLRQEGSPSTVASPLFLGSRLQRFDAFHVFPGREILLRV